MTETKTKRIFISANEPSADMHCAHLIKAMLKVDPDIEFVGIGGDKMAEAGCFLIENTNDNAAMLLNVLKQLGYYKDLLKRIKTYYQENHIDLTIVCDSPSFNIHVAKIAKKKACKTLFYVAPQLWAWAPWRIRKVRKNCDKLACILPFEEDWFSYRGVDVEFVGNPLFDDIEIEMERDAKDYTNFDPSNAKIALIPGSRDAEIESLWPAMQQICMRINDRWGNCEFHTAAVSDSKLDKLRQMQNPKFQCKYEVDGVLKLARNADFALVASGSATLQVAAAGCPMVIMYQSNPLLWNLIGKWLIQTRFLSLVNIMARKLLVPEFMPYFTSIEPIFQKCSAMLANHKKLTKLSKELLNLTVPMKRELTASENTAQIALDMLED